MNQHTNGFTAMIDLDPIFKKADANSLHAVQAMTIFGSDPELATMLTTLNEQDLIKCVQIIQYILDSSPAGDVYMRNAIKGAASKQSDFERFASLHKPEFAKKVRAYLVSNRGGA